MNIAGLGEYHRHVVKSAAARKSQKTVGEDEDDKDDDEDDDDDVVNDATYGARSLMTKAAEVRKKTKVQQFYRTSFAGIPM
ncbi:unnamed protein product [Heligmosomoides polygyrus]|uniref:Uncharacterized protein n=1 Tax=Heligmosomoides polygyrus TaxID=6339 RepID=A0A3P7Y9W2_HELPZ|nr:unnamed protein product [Heligmosomoides polygyrus]